MALQGNRLSSEKPTGRIDKATYNGIGGVEDGRSSLASQFPAGKESLDQQPIMSGGPEKVITAQGVSPSVGGSTH